jgi:hypothetical protein
MFDAQAVASKLHAMLHAGTGSASRNDVKQEVEKILSDAGVTTAQADRASIKAVLDTRWLTRESGALPSTTTGACYYIESGVLRCEALTLEQCNGKFGKLVAGGDCTSKILWEVMLEEGLI